ncbi:lipocalin family protein [Rhodobacter capsulatus]|uniref:lipocalin family protein n=1 Tax=Rhodobacter capsulatus TaxID=1061 RepID=UPI0040281E64
MRRVIRAGFLAGLLALAACGQKAPEPAGSIRDPKAMITSAVLFDPARFGGEWQVAMSATPRCGGATQGWRWDGRGRYALSGVDCSGTVPAVLKGQAALTGPGGRFAPDQGYGREPIWVLWVDQDYRVAALGTPSGDWAVVLVRPGKARGDLIAAAREVLDFNGYDLKRIGG